MYAERQYTDLQDFKNCYEKGETQLFWKWVDADFVTPCAAYLKLCGYTPYCFLLESVEGGAVLGRYSIIGLDPDLIWTYQDNKISVNDMVQGDASVLPDEVRESVLSAEPVQSLRTLLAQCRIDNIPAFLPPMAQSGLFGYLGYDTVRFVEDIPQDNPDSLSIPDSIMMRPGVLAIFDNVQNRICLVHPVYDHAKVCDQSAEAIYEQARTILAKIGTTIDAPDFPVETKPQSALALPLDVRSNTTQQEYQDMVSKAVEYTKAGEIFQCVPSQRFNVDFDLPSFELYRSLRRLNPSPFLFHLSFEDFSIVGSSPEIMVRVRDDRVTIRPIAGTRKRGQTAAEDKALADDLLADEKECAEHLMLLDLGRNDVGRVSDIGSVEVTDQFIIERYSHVMHIVSNVEGVLRKDLDGLDAFFAGFPAGTVSGAPKIRAMEIIDELEKEKRCFYAGSVGYFSGDGSVDTCIALRTALVKDDKVYIQAGAGVVLDSIPESEYQETVSKAQAIIRAAEIAIERSKPE